MDFLPRTLAFYILSHAFLFWHWYRLLGKRRVAYWLLPWFALMGLFPFVFSLLPAGGVLQHAFAKAGSVWLPFAFFSLVAFVIADGVGILVFGLRCLFGYCLPSPARKRRYIALLALAAACVYGYGLYEARHVTLATFTVPTSKLPATVDRVRVAFAADLHIGPQTGTAFLARTVDLILSQRPDIILLGGDILDDAVQGTPEDIGELARLTAPLGVYAVLGNHDSFGGYGRAVATVNRTGITLLENQRVTAGPLTVVGLDDPDVAAQKDLEGTPRPDASSLLAGAPTGGFTILLDHRPVLRQDSVGRFDLQLSGHSHGGQLVMLKSLLEGRFGTPTGVSRHEAADGVTTLFVTTGVGFSKLPIRLGVPPEIAVIDITRQNGAASGTP